MYIYDSWVLTVHTQEIRLGCTTTPLLLPYYVALQFLLLPLSSDDVNAVVYSVTATTSSVPTKEQCIYFYCCCFDALAEESPIWSSVRLEPAG